MNLEKSTRIGIDWLSVYNFEIEYSPEVKVVNEFNDDYLTEKLNINETLFSIDSSTRLYEKTNKITEYKCLRFNPNKILYGHNIYNSRSEDLLLAIDELKKILKQNGIKVDLKNALIKEIEINCNFEREFEELKESFELLFIQSPDLKKISNFEGGKSYKKMFVDRTIQGRWQSCSCIAYDKRNEVNQNSSLKILENPLSRLEWRINKSTYQYQANKRKYSNSLDNIINDFSVIDEIFKELTFKKMFEPGKKYLESKLKVELERGYIAFKSTSKLSKSKGMKIERNIFKYLEENYWIFDSFFLEELISKYDKPHKTREIKRIKEKYFHHNNLEKLNYLMKIIFNH